MDETTKFLRLLAALDMRNPSSTLASESGNGQSTGEPSKTGEPWQPSPAPAENNGPHLDVANSLLEAAVPDAAPVSGLEPLTGVTGPGSASSQDSASRIAVLTSLIRPLTAQNAAPGDAVTVNAISSSSAVPTGSSAVSSAAPNDGNSEQVSKLVQQLEQLTQASLAQAATVAENTKAVTDNTQKASSSQGRSTASTIGSTLLSTLGGGLGLVSLVSGLWNLFGGGDNSAAADPLTRFQMPNPIRAEAGLWPSRNEMGLIDYAGGGVPRAMASSSAAITVQVQAMDSQSFLDRSDDIARAVREAMLNSHALNDMVADL